MKNDNIYWNHNTFYYKWIKEQIKPNSKVLDVGCGDGTLAFYLKDVCNEIVGIDPFKECIDTAKDLYSNYNNICFINSSFEDFKYDKEYFDVVIFVASIHHLDLKEAILKAKALLKEKGQLLIVGIASPTTLIDWTVELLRVIPCAISSKLHHMISTEQNNVPTLYSYNTMDEIRTIINDELLGATLEYGLYYRYLLSYQKCDNKSLKRTINN